MGNRIQSPAYSYEFACSQLGADEVQLLRSKFRASCRAEKTGLDQSSFINNCQKIYCPYARKTLLRRLFCFISGGADALIKFEDYLGSVSMFRLGSREEKLKCNHIISHFSFFLSQLV